MFLRTQFVFLDYDESLISFYIDYLAMMGLFIWIAYYLLRIFQKTGRQHEDKGAEDGDDTVQAAFWNF